jgi:serine/threonine protein kinase
LGDALKDCIHQHNQVPKEKIECIGIKLLNAVEQMHKVGYLHCDIKPDNILFGFNRGPYSNDPLPFIVDFGKA